MTKQMFVHELRVALAQVDSNVRDEIIADISEHFTEGAAQGLSEEDICRSLGQPGTIAAQVLEEQGSQTSPPPQENNYSHFDNGFTKKSYGSDIDKTFTGVNQVTAKLSASNLNLVPSTNGEFRVTVTGCSDRDECSAENVNGNLIITVKRTKQLFGFGFLFNKSIMNAGIETTIYVPAQFAGGIDTKSTAGNVTSTGISGELNLDTTAGNITIDRHRCRSARIRTAAGNVRVALASNIVEHMTLDTGAGSIDFEANETRSLSINTGAGEAVARVGKIGGDTKMSSGAGNVLLTAKDVEGNIKLTTGMGSIDVYLPANVNCRIAASRPGMGSLDNQLTGNPQSPYVLRASSGMGSIHLKAL